MKRRSTKPVEKKKPKPPLEPLQLIMSTEGYLTWRSEFMNNWDLNIVWQGGR